MAAKTKEDPKLLAGIQFRLLSTADLLVTYEM